MARHVLASTEARDQLPKLIDELVAHPDETFEVGRQRRREVVLVAASRYDEMVEREDAVRDLAWALFAEARIDSPTSEPISWKEAQRRRTGGR
jgi:PHD/YefM family antitoxin component YafN of YafNO toxin-antitoxin module